MKSLICALALVAGVSFANPAANTATEKSAAPTNAPSAAAPTETTTQAQGTVSKKAKKAQKPAEAKTPSTEQKAVETAPGLEAAPVTK